MDNKRYKDITNKVFGNLTALKKTDRPIHIKTRSTYWLCRCVCGKEHVAKLSSLQYGEIKSCGCLHGRSKERSHIWKGAGEVYGDYVSNYKRRAEKKNLEFNLDADYLWNLYLQQNKKCYISGLPIVFARSSTSHDGNLSLDRIDSSKGYVKGNVGWVDKRINHMKWDLPLSEFLELCNIITNNEIKYN